MTSPSLFWRMLSLVLLAALCVSWIPALKLEAQDKETKTKQEQPKDPPKKVPPKKVPPKEEQPGWVHGKGWDWRWGADDEVGALNHMTSETRQQALKLAQTGKVYDLGITYSRKSFRWPGHSPARNHDLSLTGRFQAATRQ